jgi:hypothetical protein
LTTDKSVSLSLLGADECETAAKVFKCGVDNDLATTTDLLAMGIKNSETNYQVRSNHNIKPEMNYCPFYVHSLRYYQWPIALNVQK